ncbi:M48 family metalloprotease [Sphingomonas jatrophae]|uniref:Putative Zn-dependent protease n=1 Tax=Sphingomonas jatrophae TaxID=1166337 RepID=A0A1I6JXG9_9SPHN|nr:M48 family metalloprotease [Sphingomonas jatrophae]SFR83657.1 Putative Zn-dependent protease [Sphingomonas jatrophae]
MSRPRRFGTLALALLLAACGSSPEQGSAPSVSEEDRAYGAEQHPKLLAEFGGAYAGRQSAYVAALGERIATAAGLPGRCTFTLVNSDVVNAFAVPGCFIYVTRGLVAVVRTEAELASVLGHEVGHILGSHAQRQQRRSVWRTLGVLAVSLSGSEAMTRLAGQAAQYFTLRYSRTQEYEADDLGLHYLQQAGYDPYAAAGMLGALQRQERFMAASGGRDAARGIPEWALSHPLTEHRVERALTAARETGLADDALPERKQAYLDAVDGMLYGDDPQQGFVLGRRFAHPVMRIAFEAPPGFALTNSPTAVQLSGPAGLRGEFGGGPMPSGGVEAYAEQLLRQIVGDGPAQVEAAERIPLDGISAVALRASLAGRNGPVPLSIAVYDDGAGGAFHFVIIASPSDPQTAQIADLFRSFTRLSAAEAATLRPRVIETVVAKPGDTATTLSRRVADPHPQALFLLLNDLPANTALTPGTRIKTVRYGAPR